MIWPSDGDNIVMKKEYSCTIPEAKPQNDEPYINSNKIKYGLTFDVID